MIVQAIRLYAEDVLVAVALPDGREGPPEWKDPFGGVFYPEDQAKLTGYVRWGTPSEAVQLEGRHLERVQVRIIFAEAG